jgi:hypothetical protein
MAEIEGCITHLHVSNSAKFADQSDALREGSIGLKRSGKASPIAFPVRERTDSDEEFEITLGCSWLVFCELVLASLGDGLHPWFDTDRHNQFGGSDELLHVHGQLRRHLGLHYPLDQWKSQPCIAAC